MIQRTLLVAALPLALPLVLAGCLSFGAKPPPTLFSLTPASAAPAGATAAGTAGTALIVEEPETDRRLGVQRIPVQVDASNVAYLKDALWVERPARLFAGLLAETLRARGGRLVFEASQAEAPGAVRLGGRLIEMGYDARSQSVVVRFDAVRSAGGAITTKRFESTVQGIAPKPEQVGPALNRAANDVAAQVAEWVG
ncbi:MAG: ABC-type transport auxiliary lipoprotein family protein [Novosphingobium sp.]